jgi:hypothetical protein
MPIKADRGSNLNQPQEIGRKDTQRTVDAWPEMDPNRPADSQTTGRQSRAGSGIREGGAAPTSRERGELRKEPGRQTKTSLKPGPRR